eukprot:TRINITY_DN11691_c0_g1_i1.p1 TRINITY_DN11691_c0_g1~~TRINITY_DN11691_c0_g1_i1.p1  ORF type:complete len:215 (+),score=82.39 TRINITY_DN11691_c0_g1_i1:142-786(+)
MFGMLKMFMPLILVYMIRNGIDTSDETNVVYMRAFFIVGKLIVVGLYGYVYLHVTKSTDTREIKVSAADLQPPNPFAKAMGADLMDTEAPETMTCAEYDMKMLKSKLSQLLMQCCIIGFLHYYNGLVIPLILSVVMGMSALPNDQLIQIHVLGRDPTDPDYASDLKRPFKQHSPFGDMMKPWQDAQEAQKKQEEKRALRQQKKALKKSANTKRK